MEIETSYSREENMADGEKDTRRAASYDDLENLTPSKIPRKDNMHDKQIAAAMETDDVDSKEKNTWDPEFLEVPFHEFETLPYEQQNENMWDGAEVIQRSASCNDLEKLTLNDVFRKGNIVAVAPETDRVDSKETHIWDPELLEVPFHEFKTLPYEQRRLWLIAHFILKSPENVNFFQNVVEFEDRDEGDKHSLRMMYPNIFGHRK